MLKRYAGKTDGKDSMNGYRYQEKQPDIAMEPVELEIRFILHQPVGEFKTRQAAAGHENKHSENQIEYSENKNYPGCNKRMKKNIH